MRKYIWKKIWVSNKNFVIVRIYHRLEDMQDEFCRQSENGEDRKTRVLGAHCPFFREKYINGRWKLHKQIGIVLLQKDRCGAGIVSHELMHACLWAWRFSRRKKQYPIVINSMVEEEIILHNHTNAVIDFYNWFFSRYKETKSGKSKPVQYP